MFTSLGLITYQPDTDFLIEFPINGTFYLSKCLQLLLYRHSKGGWINWAISIAITNKGHPDLCP